MAAAWWRCCGVQDLDLQKPPTPPRPRQLAPWRCRGLGRLLWPNQRSCLSRPFLPPLLSLRLRVVYLGAHHRAGLLRHFTLLRGLLERDWIEDICKAYPVQNLRKWLPCCSLRLGTTHESRLGDLSHMANTHPAGRVTVHLRWPWMARNTFSDAALSNKRCRGSRRPLDAACCFLGCWA